MYAPVSQPVGIPFLRNGSTTVLHTYVTGNPKRRPAPILFRYLRKLDFETLLNALSSLCRPSLNEVLQPMLSYHRCHVIEKLLCSMIIGVLCKNSGPCPRAEF